ncbi:uncharacterized protein PGTG_19939 [Puccinia graminis f. sp. tritici CRL 75-36-700-3]|uniref:CxC1-like cysteine cluster associated with KDZ transposases domain-containing protein n=1 Tax=Puccinia graminis f. sp. tritici (strain CRL 75-36-700-3 / race SCCL) TaxID=418459 RepID=E3LBR3_PUCGT|nr:uncharacterized protein PGTG_19939 [Puccinia graminis f. sp. tritici CRL 75-36-700-3]EFP93985.1 hypothetical protein PGTG_19939 [Puccinia graminis f. sp. tritici CRL 75-36-700-3]
MTARKQKSSLHQFHKGSRMPRIETRSQKDYRNKMRKHTAAEVSDITTTSVPVPLTELIPEDDYLHNTDQETSHHDHQETSHHDQDQDAWYDIPDEMRPEDAESLRQIRSHHQALIQQQKLRNWSDLMISMFPAYLHLKKKTQNWSQIGCLEDFSKDLCKCTPGQRNWREVDLIDLMGSVDAYRHLKRLEQDLIQTTTACSSQDILAQRSCPACFGVSLPVDHESQPSDTSQVFLCLDGNFQHRHHEKASKNHLPLHTPHLFVTPEEIQASNDQILTHEKAQKKTEKAKDRCTEQHKAADDRRNASTWKGCDDTGLFGCCCRHDSVIYFCNIHKSGEGRGLPMSILKRLLGELNPNIQLGVLYDIGCTLGKFFESRNLLTKHLPRMKFATAVFHSYVHDWACQLKFNPRYNKGWGLTDGEGLERLWSYLSPLVGPQRYATRNRRLGGINHRSVFHNMLGMEKLLLTLKRKTLHAITHQKDARTNLDKLLSQPNPHQRGTCFTEDFFWAQWEAQRAFHANLNEEEVAHKEELAQFFERGETIKTLVEMLVSGLKSHSQSDPTQMMNQLSEIQMLQAKQDEETKKLGSHFGTANIEDEDQQKRLGLLYSAKLALYKAAVQIQGELQPLRDSKGRGERLGTVLKEKIFDALDRRKKSVISVLNTFQTRRTDYLRNHCPEQLDLPENAPIDYHQFKKIPLDDPFWNNGYMCLSKDPWAINPNVRSGIHAVLALERSKEELVQLTIELRRTVSCGISHRDQVH